MSDDRRRRRHADGEALNRRAAVVEDERVERNAVQHVVGDDHESRNSRGQVAQRRREQRPAEEARQRRRVQPGFDERDETRDRLSQRIDAW